MKNLITFLVAASLVLSAAGLKAGELKMYSTGTYVDRNNAAHPWSINEHHALIWDGNPYVPVGGVFYSRYVSEGQTEANWQEDVKSLELLKSKGVTDLLLKNVGPASWVSAEAWQKLIDYLETNGFTYGLDLSDNPKGVLTGYVIRPHRYRLAHITNDGTYTFNIPDAVSAFYVLARPDDPSAARFGTAQAADGKISIDIKVPMGSDYVLLLYPEVDISGHGDGGIPNLWDGYDAFRDRLLAFLGKIKFGKGFRFFLDPFDVRMSMVGNLATAVPDSPGFRLEFEAWLQKKYPLSANVATSWGIVAQDLPSIEAGARLLPLWNAGKGVAQAYDRASGSMKEVTVQESGMWEDITEFRDSSIRSYMNEIADVLKKQIADVPVVFRMGEYYRVYTNTQMKGGFDGLAVDAFGRGQSLVCDRVGPAYSLTAESAKTMWTIVSSYLDAKPSEKTSPGFSSTSALTADLDLLREAGAKGVFVYALQMSPKVVSKNLELLQTPDQLSWLADFKKSRMKNSADFTPTIVYYPASSVSGAVAKRLGAGAWWLPSLRPARTFSMGDEILGYSFMGDDLDYIWSLNGPQTVSLRLQKGQQPLIAYPDPPGDRAVVDRDVLSLKLSEDPIGVRGFAQNQLFPINVAQAEMDKLENLIPEAEKAGQKVIAAKNSLGSAKKVLKSGSAFVAYDMAHTAVLNLQAGLSPYAWLEGESTIAQNFDRIVGGEGASFGRYLLLDTDADAPMEPYGATYLLTVPTNGTYSIWLAGYVPGDTGSPMSYTLDNKAPVEIADAKPVGAAYGPGFNWTKIGAVNLAKGEHTLKLTVTGRRSSDKRYVMAIDAIAVTSGEFKPSGIKRP